MQARAIDESGVVETLDAVDRLYGVRVEAEAATFVLAAHFADLMAGEGLPVSRRVLPGRERAVRLGGEGTPLVAEFAAAEFGRGSGWGRGRRGIIWRMRWMCGIGCR